jgi:glycopeptide antibiotics resistance protein
MRSRIALITLFAGYTAVLVWAVLWKLELPHVGEAHERGIKLVPFVASNGFGASAPLEVAANVLLFAPLGAFLRVIATGWRPMRIVCTLAAASLALEVLQYVLAVGSSDSTDVISNTVGGIAGMGLVLLSPSPILATRLLAAATLVAIAIAFVVPRSRPPEAPLGGTTDQIRVELPAAAR